ncbi:Putative zinc-type alcohol dehydrogenase-like protein YjmD [Sphingomonas antarctica]|uniref:zinc-dependent alcohol dehydrogenase n=1 Tax=Sphingomonas antarctica TaxID=2040274 RepID=UPI0039E7F5A9
MKALILNGPCNLAFEDTPDAPLAPAEVRVRTLYSGISAGTELTQYRGTSPFMNRQWDEARRLFVPGGASWSYPIRNLGYEEAGEIVELGSAVTGLRVGQRIYGAWHHRSHHIADQDWARDRLMPEGLDPRAGIFSHIGAVALNGVHDARIRIGDVVAVFGLGVPGQIVAQAARASGATVITVDPDAQRRGLALKFGAKHAIPPENAAETIKELTQNRGADACIEVSGAAPALSEAIRAVAYSSRVVAMGFFQGELSGIRLGDEFHHNRVELVCSQISGTAPEAQHRWSKPRLWRTAIELQAAGVLDLIPLITDPVPFAEAPTLFARLDRGALGVMQSVLEF